MSRRKAIGIAALVAAIGLASAPSIVSRFPEIQGTKRKYVPILSVQEKYEVPTTQEEARLPPIQKPDFINTRATLEDKIAELIITRSSNIHTYYPGGVLLSKPETRQGHLFGAYCSYDPKKTQQSVERIVQHARAADKRILIYDEGEGGFVPRVGSLPTAQDLADYYENNEINETLIGRVQASTRQKDRSKEVQRLFDEYATELRARSVNVVFGPVLDIVGKNKEDNMMRKQKRAFSTKYHITRDLGELYIQSMHRQGIKVVGKHFLTAGLVDSLDIHDQEATNPRRIQPRMEAGQVYRTLRGKLDAVMVSHVGNPSDEDRPYSVSRRALDYLREDRYTGKLDGDEPFSNNRRANRIFRGIDFGGLIVVDNISMRGLLDYVEREPLSERGKRLMEGCATPEARAVVLSLDAGAQTFIALDTDVDAIVGGIAAASRKDRDFERKLDQAIAAYERFVEKTRLP